MRCSHEYTSDICSVVYRSLSKSQCHADTHKASGRLTPLLMATLEDMNTCQNTL